VWHFGSSLEISGFPPWKGERDVRGENQNVAWKTAFKSRFGHSGNEALYIQAPHQQVRTLLEVLHSGESGGRQSLSPLFLSVQLF
jgi:hypothetical protein